MYHNKVVAPMAFSVFIDIDFLSNVFLFYQVVFFNSFCRGCVGWNGLWESDIQFSVIRIELAHALYTTVHP